MLVKCVAVVLVTCLVGIATVIGIPIAHELDGELYLLNLLLLHYYELLCCFVAYRQSNCEGQ